MIRNMKSLKYILTVILTINILFSCNEEEWLKEEAFDFYSPENSFSTPEQIDLAVVKLYENVHTFLFGTQWQQQFVFQYTTDVGYDAIAPNHQLNSWSDKITPETAEVRWIWTSYYKIIFNANAVLSRIGDVEYASEDERNLKIAEAKFFRAFAYRGLGIMYGGVPLVLEEINSPRRDFVRTPQTEIWNQVVSDLTDAIQHLPEADAVEQDGRLSKGAANHLLAEMYIITGEYDKAIAAASDVINDPNYVLMTERFGTRSSEPGDVYWDLFRRGNQNREGAGQNRESIWVSQYEFNVPGGGADDNIARFLGPLYWQIKDNDGVNLFLGPSNSLGGRGIGWWAASDYMLIDVWQNANADIRNSEFNIIRDARVENPESRFFGQMMIASGAATDFLATDALKRWWSAVFAKGASINNLPDELIADPETGVTTNSAAHLYRDHYIMRLAETYLLRAEAHILKGDQVSAAADINVVRARSNADPVAAGDVDMDYLLDERARELFNEELRLLTLMRMGNVVERVRQYNPMHNGQYASNVVNDHQNLWPIPSTDIERNTEAVLEQNPGYF